ncbi:hypothetical protein R4Z10_09275 [Niallia sp. XMNu-256]
MPWIEFAAKKCGKFVFVQRKNMIEDEKIAMEYHNQLVKDIKSSFIEENQ